jgi:hypothetical protein
MKLLNESAILQRNMNEHLMAGINSRDRNAIVARMKTMMMIMMTIMIKMMMMIRQRSEQLQPHINRGLAPLSPNERNNK